VPLLSRRVDRSGNARWRRPERVRAEANAPAELDGALLEVRLKGSWLLVGRRGDEKEIRADALFGARHWARLMALVVRAAATRDRKDKKAGST
jgi:hypothetical protein